MEDLRLLPTDEKPEEVMPAEPPGFQKIRDLLDKIESPADRYERAKAKPIPKPKEATTMSTIEMPKPEPQPTYKVVGEPPPGSGLAPARMSLITKLALITAAVERVPKRGLNKYQNYQFATDADIFDALRSLCAEHHVWVQYSMVPGSARYEYWESQGKQRVRTTFDGIVTVHDGDSGDKIESFWPAFSHDNDDKGVNKASTGFAKFAMIRLFSISTGEDPEHGDPGGGGRNAAPQARPAPAPAPQVQQARPTPAPAAQQTAERQLGPEDAERASLIRGAYAILKLDPSGKAKDDPIHAEAMEQVANALMMAKVPKKWADFSTPELRSFAAGQYAEI
jgi:hypothetical protein